MSKSPVRPASSHIRLRNVRQNNLKGFDLDLAQGELIVVTGLSGSGKSSLAFDTLYAEGQRRYIETFSPYARQFFDRMDKPAVDRIENIPPAIAIEQRNAVRSTRSTVGTITELCEHLKALWTHLAQLHCRKCGQVVRKEPPAVVWESLTAGSPGVGEPGSAHRRPRSRTAGVAEPVLREAASPWHADDPGGSAERLVTFQLPLSDRMSLAEQLALLQKQGFQRLLVDGQVVRCEDAGAVAGVGAVRELTVIADRVKLVPAQRARFIDACEQAYHFGRGHLAVQPASGGPVRRFSAGFHCAACDLDYREPTPALFSFNNPVGACPECRGFGRIITIDPNLALPDRSLSLEDGVVRPWRTGTGAESQKDLLKAARRRKVPLDVPFRELPADLQSWVVDGDEGYVPDDPKLSWPKLWYGVKGYFRWLESKAYKMHVRVLLSRYRSYRTCPSCQGRRFQPDSLLFRVPVPEGVLASGARSLTLSDFYSLPVRAAHDLVEALHAEHRPARHEALGVVMSEIRSRLGFLTEIGLGYLTLDRPTRTLSGGETERVNLTSCLGSRLVNTLYVLDEPSVGLHPRDTDRLVRVLHQLRDLGNTVVVVEHEASVMRAADQLVDLGPGHGDTGGHVVYHGPPGELDDVQGSLTADYLSGRRSIPLPLRRPVAADGTSPLGAVRLQGATLHNLRNLSVTLPLGRLVVISGVSGSGKTTLVREFLLPLLKERLGPGGSGSPAGAAPDEAGEAGGDDSEWKEGRPAAAQLGGSEFLGDVVLVDQSPLGRTPRSNPAVYVGAFEDLRELFGHTERARSRGLNASAFSFNSSVGQCDQCRGAGFEKIEMQFLSDVFIQCPACQGRRYRNHILEIQAGPAGDQLSIAGVLESSVDRILRWLEPQLSDRHARRAQGKLALLAEVGLGYLRLGQPINTLSGGESQRLKLASHLAAFASGQNATPGRPTLFIFDEPTTGLHFEDVRILMAAFQRLVDAGHSVVVIEHNLDVLRCADWIIDLGPEAGEGGGQVVAAGTPETVAACEAGHTGRHLRTVLPS